MASVQTFYLPHYPTYPIYISLFKDVKNAKFLRQQLLEGNTAFEYAFLDATMILSPAHLYAAAFRALHSHLTDRLKSRNIHSELVFALSPNNNIAEAYRRFGISDNTSTLLAVKVSLSSEVTAESVSKHLAENVEGQSVDLGGEGEDGEEKLRKALDEVSDLGAIKKIYKLNAVKQAKGKKGGAVNGANGASENDDERKDIESVILGTMALKGS